MELLVFTEEQSAEAALRNILPKIFENKIKFQIFPHQGKRDLLKKLPHKLHVYSQNLKPDQRIVILIDRDKEDCISLKKELEQIVNRSGLASKNSAAKDDNYNVVIRIACEELESWFIGDIDAIKNAFERFRQVPKTWKTPDSVPNSWEALEKALKKAGYKSLGGKIDVARRISQNMNIGSNLSLSFNAFVSGILAFNKDSI